MTLAAPLTSPLLLTLFASSFPFLFSLLFSFLPLTALGLLCTLSERLCTRECVAELDLGVWCPEGFFELLLLLLYFCGLLLWVEEDDAALLRGCLVREDFANARSAAAWSSSGGIATHLVFSPVCNI